MHLKTGNSEKRRTPITVSKEDILKLAQRRLKKCVSIAPRLLVDDDVRDIHDLRVWSRRLQQLVGLLLPKPHRGKSRKVIQSLRNLRGDWSACRNLDVNLDLVREKLESLNTGGARNAWHYARGCIVQLRAKEFDRARRRLRRLDIVALAEGTQRLFEKVEAESGLDLRQSLSRALDQWNEAMRQAKQSRDPQRLHVLRISGKRLRYRLEVLAELGDGDAQSRVELCKAFQDQLGRWHDWHELLQLLENLNEKPEFVRDHPEFQQMLARDIDLDRRKNSAAIDEILKQAEMLQRGLDSYKAAVEKEDGLPASS
jgi:CHAD domain-containing protein